MWDITSSRRWGVRCRGNRTINSQTGSANVEKVFTKGNVANLSIPRVLHTRNALELKRRVSPEQDLGGILNGSSSRINKLLNEDLSENPICLFSEDGAEYHRDSVMAGLDEDCFLVAIMNGHDLATFSDALWRLF
jgi:hypothetical protein